MTYSTIKRKEKICKGCQQPRFIFSHGYCKTCSMIRKAKDDFEANKEQSEKDREFYSVIWSVHPHICYECGASLGYQFKKWFAHHLLPKSEYPEFRHTPENIALLCLIHHRQAEDDIDKCPQTKELAEKIALKLLP